MIAVKPNGEPGLKQLFFSLAELQGFVGGNAEVVKGLQPMSISDELGRPVADIKRQVMVVNEEGLLRELPYNPMATVLAGRTILGDVLICYRSQIR